VVRIGDGFEMKIEATCDCDCFPKECNGTRDIFAFKGSKKIKLTVKSCDDKKRKRNILITRSEAVFSPSIDDLMGILAETALYGTSIFKTTPEPLPDIKAFKELHSDN
jgi:hypothetical protein